MRNVVGAIILAWALCLPGRAAELVPAADLRADALRARAEGVPLLVLFSLHECVYCERVRREFLEPLPPGRALLRQVDVGADRPLKDFSGRDTSHGAFAKAHRIALAPVVKVFDAEGREAAEPLVGLLTPELYGLYLELALDQGTKRMDAPGAAAPGR